MKSEKTGPLSGDLRPIEGPRTSGRFVAALVLLVSQLISARGTAQTQSVPVPAFDVVSLKHTGSYVNGRGFNPIQFKGGRLTADVPLLFLLEIAYPLEPWEFSGPDWVSSECYGIGAIAPADTKLDTMRAMLRTALAERLGLKCHLEDRETAIYALVAGSGRLQLAPAPDGA